MLIHDIHMAMEFDDEIGTQLRPPKLLISGENQKQKQKQKLYMSYQEQGSTSRGTTTPTSESISSGFSTPLGSDLISSTDTTTTTTTTSVTTDDHDSDDADFISQLTLQMADYMLREDDDEDDYENTAPNTSSVPGPIGFSGTWPNYSLKYSGHAQELSSISLNANSLSAHVKKNPSTGTGFFSTQIFNTDQLNDQNDEPQGKRENRAGSNHARKPEQRIPRKKQNQHLTRGTDWELRPPPVESGSAMRAMFLGGPDSRNGGSSGTGVFLPRVTGDTGSEPRKKPGRSTTVLIPTRVLKALEIHFNRLDALSRSEDFTALPHRHVVDHHGRNGQKEHFQTVGEQQPEAALPQEWTY